MNLVNNILNYSRLESGSDKLVNTDYRFSALLQELEESTRSAIGKKQIFLEMKVESSLPSVLYGDRNKIKTVLWNILQNAVKYTGKGKITLRVCAEKTDRKNIFLQFCIDDTGPGMMEKDREKVRKMIRQVQQDAPQESGLGLMVAGGFVRMMDGDIELLESEAGGCLVRIRILPKIRDDLQIGNYHDSNFVDETVYTSEMRILIVDDDPINIKVLIGMLRNTGMRIDAAGNGYEALRLTEDVEYDLILLDHRMPGMDGIETFGKMQEIWNRKRTSVPVIMLSAELESDMEEKNINMGLAGFPAHGNTLIGHKHFDDSDYTVHRSKDWMSSVKMASRRVIGTELVNEDNLKGYYLGDGATYYYVRGDEYLEVFPFWDWRKIPGVTSYEDIAPMPDVNVTRSGNNSDLVGGLSNGKIGMTAMELNRDGLEAHKVWLFADKFVFCLGADIHSDTTLCVTTSIDQRSKSGELYVWNKKKWSAITGAEAFRQKDLRFFHDAVGYIVLDGDTCVAQSEEREGRWSDFMGMYTPATLHGEVAALHLRHGVKPSGASYQYIVLPAATKKEVEEFDSKMIRVIKNDKVAQVVSSPACGEGYWMAVYQSENFDIEGLFFKAVLPGIYYVEKGLGGLEIKLSSPFRISK